MEIIACQPRRFLALSTTPHGYTAEELRAAKPLEMTGAELGMTSSLSHHVLFHLYDEGRSVDAFKGQGGSCCAMKAGETIAANATVRNADRTASPDASNQPSRANFIRSYGGTDKDLIGLLAHRQNNCHT